MTIEYVAERRTRTLVGVLYLATACAEIATGIAPIWCHPEGTWFILVMWGLMMVFMGLTTLFPRACDERLSSARSGARNGGDPLHFGRCRPYCCSAP